MLREGLNEAVEDLHPVEFKILTDKRIKLKITDASIGKPIVPAGTIGVKDVRVYPTECRQRAYTYRARMSINVEWSIDDVPQPAFNKDVGEVPIMLKVNSLKLCGLPIKLKIAHIFYF